MSGTTAKYPHIVVKLTDRDGNAMNIIGTVMKALAKAGVSSEERHEFLEEATSGNYDKLLQTALKWVEVE